MTFRKIMCPIDFSSGSNHAMRVAVRLATSTGAELVLAHSWHIPAVTYPFEPPFPTELFEELNGDANRALAAAVREATDLGAKRITSRLLYGVPWKQIVNMLDDDPAFDLVVMGTRGRTGLQRVLLGSVTETVVRHAPCSVLATREHGEVAVFQHVLCPVDFSESSRQAVALAADLVEPGGSGIMLLHVLELPVAYSGEIPMPLMAADLDKRRTHLEEEWASQLRAKASVPVETHSRIGWPGAQILGMLDKDPTFDLVVMGSHGRTGIRRLLLGSVAEKVVRHAACSVLVARPRVAEPGPDPRQS